ncbi:hypothetical protein Hanom_Chr01g00016721 [Helianthus anomalus]
MLNGQFGGPCQKFKIIDRPVNQLNRQNQTVYISNRLAYLGLNSWIGFENIISYNLFGYPS